MSYRPQFAYPPPPSDMIEETFHYSFDSSNVPDLGPVVPANGQVNNIPLDFERDTEFHLRAIKVLATNEELGGLVASNLQLWFKDPWGNYLSDAPICLGNYWSGAGVDVAGRVPVVIEPEIICPLGSQVYAFLVDIQGSSQVPPSFTLYGVKWRKESN